MGAVVDDEQLGIDRVHTWHKQFHAVRRLLLGVGDVLALAGFLHTKNLQIVLALGLHGGDQMPKQDDEPAWDGLADTASQIENPSGSMVIVTFLCFCTFLLLDIAKTS